MASNIPDTDARLRAQELLTTLLAGQSQTLARDKAEKSDMAELKAAMQEGFAALGELVRTEIQALQNSVNSRFDHVYGELADVNSNVRDARNTLAGLVEREGKQEEK